MCYVKGGLGGLPPSKRVRCVSEISFAMGGAQFTISSNDYFTASCILATGETLVIIIIIIIIIIWKYWKLTKLYSLECVHRLKLSEHNTL